MMHMLTNDLTPHPDNAKIYGDSFDESLLEKIKRVGILVPILVTKDKVIVSGHRRWACAKELGMELVPVMEFPSTNEYDVIQAMIMANEQRERTNEQKAREFQKLKEIEAGRAKGRQGTRTDLLENCPTSGKKNPSRDLAASKVGLSGKTAEKAAEVVNVIDAMEQTGQKEKATEIREKLNKSVNSAYSTVKPVIEERKQAAERAKEAQFKVETVSEDLSIIRATSKSYRPTMNYTNDNINWAAWSWNPVTGCLHGCEYCYARAMAGNPYYKDGFPTGFKPTFRPDRLTAPQNTKIPKGSENLEGIRRVFVSSMADLFGEWVPAQWIQEVISVCEENQQWDFLFLTKNPARYLEFTFPENCWLGATVDCQARVQKTMEAFRRVKEWQKSVFFISCEPLLEKVVFGKEDLTYIDLLIIGAMKDTEKEPEKQPKWDWIESLIVQAVNAKTLYVFKPNLTVRPCRYPASMVERSA